MGRNTSILGFPGERQKEREERDEKHGRSLPPTLPTAAETEAGGESALETPICLAGTPVLAPTQRRPPRAGL